MTEQMTIAIINSSANIIATLIGAGIAARIGKKFYNMKQLKESLIECKKDVSFLLTVEKIHIEKHKVNENSSFKNLIREEARIQGQNWSGKNTLSQN